MMWVVILVALTGAPLGQGLPLRSTPEGYPHDTSILQAWTSGSVWYAAVPALALMVIAVTLLFGCAWCHRRRKDCKPNEGAENQLFTASATQLHEASRSQPPDSGFSEPVNNNISEDNNNGPISLREMQNIANNNAAAYIVSENEERNRISRESVVEFEPLPSGIRNVDPLEHCADWFTGEDLPRSRLQYLREIGRGWFGRVVEGEIEDNGNTSPVAVQILNQNASAEERARFLDEAWMYRDVTHDHILAFVHKCLHEDPWILIFELCSMDLQQYLVANASGPQMGALNESGVPLQLLYDITSALAHLHSRGYLYGTVSSSNVLVRVAADGSGARGVLGTYSRAPAQHDFLAPETLAHPPAYTSSSEVWSLGTLIWEVCAWGAPVPSVRPPPLPAPPAPCPYNTHLYQVMQLCWHPAAECRPTAAQVHALLEHLHTTHIRTRAHAHTDSSVKDFEDRWQRLKPNSIPKIDEHVALVHAPSTSTASHFTGSDQFDNRGSCQQDTLSVDMDTAVSRSSSIMSDKDPLSTQIRSESLTNLHGSLEDVRNIYLTHNETAALECHQGNIGLEERDQDKSDSSVDPWVKDLIAGSQDDVSYYRDVSDVIKNLDNILNSEKTSSSESSHQASPSRDNLSLDCKKEYAFQSCMVKSPGISNFKNILEMSLDADRDEDEACDDDEIDRDTIGTLSHSFERHSDTTSQHTLENLTPDTPIRDSDFISEIKSQLDAKPDSEQVKTNIEAVNTSDAELPKENIVSSNSVPKKSVVSFSISETNEQLNVREDCVTPCDNLAEVRTQVETKSIDNTVQNDNLSRETVPASEVIENEALHHKHLKENENIGLHQAHLVLPEVTREVANNFVENEIIKPAIAIVSKKLEDEVRLEITKSENSSPKLDVREHNHVASIIPLDTLKHITKELIEEEKKVLDDSRPQSCEVSTQPEPVQMNNENSEPPADLLEEEKLAFSSNFSDINLEITNAIATVLPSPDLVQNVTNGTEKADYTSTEVETKKEIPIETVHHTTLENVIDERKNKVEEDSLRSEKVTDQSNDSTAYMDLINYTTSNANDSETLQDNVKDVIQSCLVKGNENDDTLLSFNKNENDSDRNYSTVYLDLPSVLQVTHNFITAERGIVHTGPSQFNDNDICASTPKGSECSTQETPLKNESEILSETKVPNDIEAAMKEQKQIADLLSPFESPTKSHPTDTYEENSSVVLGPFENCTTECKSIKTEVEFPKEEVLAFSSNFSEINLATPSPLRDVNFLHEVPDIVPEDLQFDDITLSEAKKEQTENSEDTDLSGTTKRVSPSTPPNSPGIYLASTSSQKYLVDIDLDAQETHTYPPIECDSGLSSLQKEIDLNQIELQITTKLAMAENENNMNIEYSGPLTVEGLVSEDDAILRESDAMPEEAFLAGNGGYEESLEDRSEGLSLDEECVKLLRNELELKLPLAQVAGIEPAVEPEWGELPPPPELVLCYGAGAGGALSPIQEETRHQLSAYENDAWNPSNRTESSESYPEPCNDSTAEVTDLPSAPTVPAGESGGGSVGDSNNHSTYTISRDGSANNTYTVQKDIPTSRELTMSADSLNGSPYKKPTAPSPVDDRTFNKEDEKESNCERISQVSPFLMSPTTDTSAPSVDNVTGVSTLSKTSVPTDAKHSKPSECLSKATSIDSWCSNDTLYNVEENFDDLVPDADVPELENDKELVKSASTETLTRQEDEKEISHCSTYIVNDSKSDARESFSPDSLTGNDTANDNNTYTKVKTEVTGAKSDVNESTKSQTKDLAYETLPSYSNCTTELVSGFDDVWKFAQPELVRKSPVPDEAIFSPPRVIEEKQSVLNYSPRTANASIKKMDSVELTCLEDDINSNKSEVADHQQIDIDSPHNDRNYKSDMTPSITSTPIIITEQNQDDDEAAAIPMKLPAANDESLLNSIPNFHAFVESAENKPQDITRNQDTAQLLDDNSKTSSKDGNKEGIAVDRTPTYSDIENSESLLNSVPNFHTFLESAENKPQDITCNQDTAQLLEENSKTLSKDSNKEDITVDRTPTYSDFENSAVLKPQEATEKSSQNFESGMSSGDFRQFETSARNCPQDLSSLIDASFLFLNNERRVSDLATTSNIDRSKVNNQVSPMPDLISSISLSNSANLVESQPLCVNFSIFVTDLDEEETDQPHSFIITDMPHTTRDFSVKINELNNPQEVSKTLNKNTEEESSLDGTYDSHIASSTTTTQYNAHVNSNELNPEIKLNGVHHTEDIEQIAEDNEESTTPNTKDIPNGTATDEIEDTKEITCNGDAHNFATENFIHEPLEELFDNHLEDKTVTEPTTPVDNEFAVEIETPQAKARGEQDGNSEKKEPVVNNVDNEVAVTEDFLQNEKKFCTLDSYLPLLNDIRFTGPTAEIMSTSFTQDSPTEPASPECEQDNKTDTVQDIVKEWDSDSDSHDSNSSSGEFIWKDGAGLETAVVPTSHFHHVQQPKGEANGEGPAGGEGGASDGSVGSGGSEGSGSEGDEVEFVPSSWDCRAEPSKSSLRTLQRAHHAAPDSKKRVVFKRQKYHCVYEYPRELAEVETHSPAFLPDLSTYCEWDTHSAEEAELGYGRLYAPLPLDLFSLRSGIALGTDYDEDFFISSSARPFESLGLMSSSSQFFPGMHLKPTPHDLTPGDVTQPSPPLSPLTPTLAQTKTPSLDFTTPDSGVEDITPGSTTTEEDFKTVKLPDSDLNVWKPTDSASSSESVSPSSPGGEALGGLRHTRDKLKLDLPPSPHIPSPRHNRVFNFVLDKPKRHRIPEERPTELGTTPLVMTDETPIVTTNLPIQNSEDLPILEPTFSTFGKNIPEPTFSTFGKNKSSPELESPEQKIILTDDVEENPKDVETESKVEPVKGEGTVLDSGDEDSGIESSSKATLERKTNIS